MRRRTKLLGSATFVAILLLVGWLAIPRKAPVVPVSLLIATNAPKSHESFFTAFLTNNTVSSIGLEPLVVQLADQQGRIENNLGEIWAEKDGKQIFRLPPKGVATVSPQADQNYKKLRIVVEYSYDASALPRVFSRGLRRLPLNLLPLNLRRWLATLGFVDGKLHGTVESSWMVNPLFPRTPDSPSVPIKTPGAYR